MEKHLKSHQHYIDLYDRHTIDECRSIERNIKEIDVPSPEGEKLSQKQKQSMRKMVDELHLYFVKGERYINKDKTIRKWMDEDENRDKFYESAQAPEDIRCLTCRNRLKPTFKDLWTEHDKPDRVLFMYDCVNECLPRRAFFSDGEEWRIKPNLCPNCSTALDHTSKKEDEKIITTYSCSKCSYSKVDELELSVDKVEEEIDVDFAKDRDRFCITKEEGEKYLDGKYRLEQGTRAIEEWKNEEEARQEKLKENPKGFLIPGRYSCAICHNGTPDGDVWYDEYGTKCLVCQKAVDEGEIPAYVAKDKDAWYTKYDLESSFGIKSPTLRKWIRNGHIKPRTVSYYGKGVHYELFLIEDNKDFLPPKKLVESRMGREIKDGKEEERMHPWYHFGDPYETLKGYKVLEHLKFVRLEEEDKKVTE